MSETAICEECGKMKRSHRDGQCYPDTSPERPMIFREPEVVMPESVAEPMVASESKEVLHNADSVKNSRVDFTQEPNATELGRQCLLAYKSTGRIPDDLWESAWAAYQREAKEPTAIDLELPIENLEEASAAIRAHARFEKKKLAILRAYYREELLLGAR